MDRYYCSEIEAMAAEEWPAYQDGLVQQTVTYAAGHADEVRRRLKKARLSARDIRGVADLARIPILAKEALPMLQAKDPPFGGMLATPMTQLRRIFLSPGPIYDPQGAQADYWRWAPALWAAGFRAGDVVQNTFSYHLTPAGAMFDEALHTLGCVAVPGGVGNSESQAELMAQMGVTGYIGTPSFLLTLLERGQERGLRLDLRRAFLTAAPLSSSLEQIFEQDFGLSVYQGYGTADVGAIAYDCEKRDGWHVAPGVVVEIVEPVTGHSLPAGQTGEVVVTRPDDAYPLLRFSTGDLSSMDTTPCSCGRTTPRLQGLLGRVGEGVKVKGMFVHPRQLVHLLQNYPEVARYQGVVTREKHRDVFTVRLEAVPGANVDPEALAAALREALRIQVNVAVVSAGAIAKDAQPLMDIRSWD
jgi:phenylacetate-CoA ligase